MFSDFRKRAPPRVSWGRCGKEVPCFKEPCEDILEDAAFELLLGFVSHAPLRMPGMCAHVCIVGAIMPMVQ